MAIEQGRLAMMDFKVRHDVTSIDLLEVDTRPSAVEVKDHFVVVIRNIS